MTSEQLFFKYRYNDIDKKIEKYWQRDTYGFEHKGADTFTRIIRFFLSYTLKL